MVRRFNGQKPSTTETVEVVKLEKSGGCVDRDEEYMRQLRQTQVREYFLGDARNTLSPHIQHVDFSQLSIYKIAESTSYFFLFFKSLRQHITIIANDVQPPKSSHPFSPEVKPKTRTNPQYWRKCSPPLRCKTPS